jgi:hypothetical protein
VLAGDRSRRFSQEVLRAVRNGAHKRELRIFFFTLDRRSPRSPTGSQARTSLRRLTHRTSFRRLTYRTSGSR